MNDSVAEIKLIKIILIIVALFLILTFALPWLQMPLKTVRGVNIPKFNEFLTKTTNVFHTFSPSKKEAAQTAYAIFAIPVLGIFAIIFALMSHVRFSKNTLLVTSLFSIALALYFYFRVSAALSLSNVGIGVHLLLAISTLYTALFFILPKKRKSVKPLETDKSTDSI